MTDTAALERLHREVADLPLSDLPPIPKAFRRGVRLTPEAAAQLQSTPPHLVRALWLAQAHGDDLRTALQGWRSGLGQSPDVILTDDHPAFGLMALAHFGQIVEPARPPRP